MQGQAKFALWPVLIVEHLISNFLTPQCIVEQSETSINQEHQVNLSLCFFFHFRRDFITHNWENAHQWRPSSDIDEDKAWIAVRCKWKVLRR